MVMVILIIIGCLLLAWFGFFKQPGKVIQQGLFWGLVLMSFLTPFWPVVLIGLWFISRVNKRPVREDVAVKVKRRRGRRIQL